MLITNIGNDTIIIKRNDGVSQVIRLNNQTTIRTPAGPATIADLRIGNRVTVVILDSETATAILVCQVNKN